MQARGSSRCYCCATPRHPGSKCDLLFHLFIFTSAKHPFRNPKENTALSLYSSSSIHRCTAIALAGPQTVSNAASRKKMNVCRHLIYSNSFFDALTHGTVTLSRHDHTEPAAVDPVYIGAQGHVAAQLRSVYRRYSGGRTRRSRRGGFYLFLIAWSPAQSIDRTACPRHRTYRAHRCVPPADSHPDQAGPKGNGQGRGAGQVVDCICIGFVIYPLHCSTFTVALVNAWSRARLRAKP